MSLSNAPETLVPSELPLVERAIALAAWVSVHILRPVPFAEDGIARAIAWRTDAASIAEDAELLFPGDPRSEDDCHPDVARLADRILPDGDASSLCRYHFFEATTDPQTTDANTLLRAVAAALQERRLPEAAEWPITVAGFVLGPLGLIQQARVKEHATGWYADGSLGEYLRALDRRRTGAVGFVPANAFSADRWSETWRQWYEASRVTRRDDEQRNARWLAIRESWSPGTATRAQDTWPGSATRDILKLDAPILRTLLEACLAHDRGGFFRDVDWTFAPGGPRALSRPFDQLTPGTLRQLLLVAPAELVVSCAHERGHGPYTPEWARASFSENLSSALLRAHRATGTDALLHGLVARAGGPEWDRLLHYVVKQDPAAVLRAHVRGNPVIASGLAGLTCAPYRFHDVATWDASEPGELATLERHVGDLLREERVPVLADRAHPLERFVRVQSAEEARDRVNRGRRRAEWLVKTALQYLYAVSSYAQAPPPHTVRGGRTVVPVVPSFWTDSAYASRIGAAAAASGEPPLEIPVDAALPLSPLLRLLAAAGSQVSADSPAYVLNVRDAQQELRRASEELRIAALGNLGSHDNPSSLETLREALQTLAEFDQRARSIEGALPTFVQFVRSTLSPNRPMVVEVTPYDPLGVVHPAAKSLHYVTDSWMALRGDEVYSFTDVTRNSVSVNPVILDWTPWLTR